MRCAHHSCHSNPPPHSKSVELHDVCITTESCACVVVFCSPPQVLLSASKPPFQHLVAYRTGFMSSNPTKAIHKLLWRRYCLWLQTSQTATGWLCLSTMSRSWQVNGSGRRGVSVAVHMRAYNTQTHSSSICLPLCRSRSCCTHVCQLITVSTPAQLVC